MTKEEKDKLSLETRVRLAAEGKELGKLNLIQFRDKKSKHIGVCKELVRLSEKHGNFPITVLVYFAIDKSAHKTEVFKNGYDNINVEKAETILSWLKMFADHNKNGRLYRNANIAHVLCKFYDKVSTDTEDFKKMLDKSKPNPLINVFKEAEEALKIKVEKKPKENKTKAKKTEAKAEEVKTEDITPKNVMEEAMAAACS